ncbi:MAG TPA: hypothetical protein DGG95_11615 [Cytophagales bacterium]|jgi:hypothetical protein|nr:hypothetical protein [Cytophagales bacterium]
MKKIASSVFLLAAIASANVSLGQGLLKQLKNKAAQEVNKLERNIPNSAPKPSPNKNKLSANVSRTVLVKIGSNESIDYSESCISLGASIDQVSIITRDVKENGSMQCFRYENGTRVSAPCQNKLRDCGHSSLQCSYNKLRSIDLESDEAKNYIVDETESHSMATPGVSDQQLKMMEAYMTKEQLDAMKKQLAEAQKQTAGKTYTTVKSRTIKFNGKSYGPFNQLSQFYLTPDSKCFYAVTLEIDQSMNYTYKVITSASNASIQLPGMIAPLSCIAASDNSEFAIVAPNKEMKYQVLTSKGKTLSIPDMTRFGGVWYSPSNHFAMLSNNQLSVDGQIIKTFEGVAPDACGLYVTSDGKGLTTINNNIISFADGDYFEYPMEIALTNSGGKINYKWLAFENQELVVYQKPY